MTKRLLPQQVFDTVPLLYPRIVEVFEACKLKPAELFTLTYVKHHGHKRPDGDVVVLRSALAQFLVKVLESKSPTGVSSFIGGLVNDGLLQKTSLTTEEKFQWYGKRDGRKDALALSAAGERRIVGFKDSADQLFGNLTGGFGRQLLKAFLFGLRKLCEWLLSRAKELK